MMLARDFTALRLAPPSRFPSSSPLEGEDNAAVAISDSRVRWGVMLAPVLASTPHPGPPPQGGREGETRESWVVFDRREGTEWN
jgi:hypothetical protein